MSWEDLSDSELRARLEQRGVHPMTVDALVDHRDGRAVAERIDAILD